MMPFIRLNCGVFDLTPCCDTWIKTPIKFSSSGCVSKSTYWNSQQMNAFRKSIADGSYSNCLTTCPMRNDINKSDLMKTICDIESSYPKDIADAITAFIRSEVDELHISPYEVGLSYDATCNLMCIPCRRTQMKFTPAFTTVQEGRVRGYFGDAGLVYISGDGDPFASDYYRSILVNDIRDKFPSATQIIIQTNGVLLSESMWNSIHPYNRSIIKQITVSIDACTSRTYMNVRGRKQDVDVFDVLCENLRFLYELRLTGVIHRLVTSYTISSYNIHDAIDFVEFAKRYGFDLIEYWTVNDWKRSNISYETMAVHLPGHADHDMYIAISTQLRDMARSINGIQLLIGYPNSVT